MDAEKIERMARRAQGRLEEFLREFLALEHLTAIWWVARELEAELKPHSALRQAADELGRLKEFAYRRDRLNKLSTREERQPLEKHDKSLRKALASQRLTEDHQGAVELLLCLLGHAHTNPRERPGDLRDVLARYERWRSGHPPRPLRGGPCPGTPSPV
jgi:hypothetical protein